jgi:protoporphyrinogen oxidase
MKYDVVIIGAGITGLTAARDLLRSGKTVCIIEKEAVAGGLASTFEFDNHVEVEKFYHHWFNSDRYVIELIEDLELGHLISSTSTNTGLYFNERIWKLSSPIDLLKFKPLHFFDRIRLGLLVYRVRSVKNWKTLESLSIREWLEPLVGNRAFRVVWEPLISSKFATYSEKVSAVWMWKKLDLRGGTRKKGGSEELLYLEGGFNVLIKKLVSEIQSLGGVVEFSSDAEELHISSDNKFDYVTTEEKKIFANFALVTTAFPVVGKLMSKFGDEAWLESLNKVHYLGNICLVLCLSKSLSSTYWLNVNDPGFPFVGVIEHTNFDKPSNYSDTHIVYLSKYIDIQLSEWKLSDEDYLEYALPFIKKMFPNFEREWVVTYKVWRAEYAQPVVERNYSQYLPAKATPVDNLMLSNMAHIYPEDRGTNYAVREGKIAAEEIRLRLS